MTRLEELYEKIRLIPEKEFSKESVLEIIWQKILEEKP